MSDSVSTDNLSQEERMSSISNETRRDDIVRRTKEDFNNKESESTRKHKAELRELTERYQEELEKVKTDHETKVQQLQGYLTNRLSRQEQEHQGQMQEIRDVFTQQQRKKLEEIQSVRDNQKETYDSELLRQKNTYDNQKARLETQFSTELNKKDEAFKNYAQFSRDEAAQTWNERRAKLQKSTDEQLNQERGTHQTQIANVNRELSEVRKLREADVNQLKLQNTFEKNRIETINLQNKQNQEKINNTVHESMAVDTQNQQNIVKAKYREEIDQKMAKVEDSQKDFREKIGDRLNRQLSSLKLALKNEQSDRVVEKVAIARQADLEKDHVVTDYEKRLADERQQKERLLTDVNQKIGGEVTKAVTSRDILLKDLSEKHLRDSELTRAQSSEQMLQLKTEMKMNEDHVTQRADAKIERANELVRQNNVKMQKFYNENLDLIKKDFMKELNDERIRHIEQRAEIENRLEKKVREREQELTRDVDQKIIGFQDKFEEQKEKFANELRHQEELFKNQNQARERTHKDELKSLEMKYENQIQQTKESYGLEMDSMDKRHREEMNQLAQKLSERQKRS